jgi:lipoate-protein ligase A
MTEFETTTWRLIRTPPASGVWNMAVDEAILEAVGRDQVPPTLRLYAWHPPCLSLGYAQPFSDVDQGRLSARGWEVVRRPTGGRAILHTDELTYSVIAPHSDPRLIGGVLESYRTLAQALLCALQQLEIAAFAVDNSSSREDQSVEKRDKEPPNPVCFDVPSNYEITVDGKKLIGSAQARRKDGVLQHGSLPLFGDLTRITQVLTFEGEIARRQAALDLLAHATTAETSLGSVLNWNTAADAFENAFRSSLNLEFQQASLTPAELSRVDALIAEKYAHPGWTERT